MKKEYRVEYYEPSLKEWWVHCDLIDNKEALNVLRGSKIRYPGVKFRIVSRNVSGWVIEKS